jgi:hypothetical protein
MMFNRVYRLEKKVEVQTTVSHVGITPLTFSLIPPPPFPK